MTHAELIEQFKQFRDENSIESKIKRIQNDPTIDAMRKEELISDLLYPDKHERKVESAESELPTNVGHILGLLAGTALPLKLSTSNSLLTKGLLAGLGGAAGYIGGGLLGSGLSSIFSQPSIQYQPSRKLTYNTLMGFHYE